MDSPILLLLSNILKFFIPIGLLIWALFVPLIAGCVYLVIYGLFISYLFLIDSFKPNLNLAEFTKEEITIIKKYHLALQFPFGSRDMSAYLNGFRLSGIPWAILFLWNRMWFGAIFVCIGYFITSSISVRLDPFFFLSQAVQNGKQQFIEELSLLQKVHEKLNHK